MLGKEKRNREVQQDVAGKMNLSKDDIFKNLIIEYASSRMDLIIKLRQKRITDEEFMAYVDESLKKNRRRYRGNRPGEIDVLSIRLPVFPSDPIDGRSGDIRHPLYRI